VLASLLTDLFRFGNVEHSGAGSPKRSNSLLSIVAGADMTQRHNIMAFLRLRYFSQFNLKEDGFTPK